MDDKLEIKHKKQILLQEEGELLASKIASLPDLPPIKLDMTKPEVWQQYLTVELLKSVADLTERVWNVNNDAGNLSKAKALNNFIKLCTEKGMRFANPFNCYMIIYQNWDNVLRNFIPIF